MWLCVCVCFSFCTTWLHYKVFSFFLTELQPQALSDASSSSSGGRVPGSGVCLSSTVWQPAHGAGRPLHPHHLHPLSQGWLVRECSPEAQCQAYSSTTAGLLLPINRETPLSVQFCSLAAAHRHKNNIQLPVLLFSAFKKVHIY